MAKETYSYSPELLPKIANALGVELHQTGALIVGLGDRHSVLIADDAYEGGTVLRLSGKDNDGGPKTITERHIDGAQVDIFLDEHFVTVYQEEKTISQLSPDSVRIFDPEGVLTEFNTA